MHLGNDLLGASYSNPYGHYEDSEVVAFHDRLLKVSGGSWQSHKLAPFMLDKKDWRWLVNYGASKSTHPSWGIKDPRVCLFLPYWRKVFPSMSVLYVYRPCIQCVYSIKRRAARDLLEGKATRINMRFWTEPDLAIKMYLFYAKSALNFLENFKGQWAVLKLSNLTNGRDIVSEIRENWDYPLHDLSVKDIFDNEVLAAGGPNEVIYDDTLLDEIAHIDNRMDELSKKSLLSL
jgi:hypothetical protein